MERGGIIHGGERVGSEPALQHRRNLEKVCPEPDGPSCKLENAEEDRCLLHQKLALSGGNEAVRGATLTRAPLPPPRLVPRPSVTSSWWWPFSRPDSGRLVIPDLLDDRSMMRSRSEQEAMDHRLVMECLGHYNANHPDNEYVPAPGMVTRYFGGHNGACWTHGNFLARPKRSGCFSFLPAPRTLFFYELVSKDDFDGIVSCTPLDEPVTEAYSLLGLRLGWGVRRDGRWDCRCKTCNCLVYGVVPYVGKSFPCGHYEAERVCKICTARSTVLHPLPGKFCIG